ncbi:MAG: helix-turn-helix domain-containing protein [Tannerella sp.]|nr:helix-turn-helix domain-containing protein [Tannerella sp.]
MKDCIIRIMQEEKMNPSQFSDAIGVQRATISHILSERNKPSLDIIKKILTRFATINPDWLLSGEGPMRRTLGNSDAFAAKPFSEDAGSNSNPDDAAKTNTKLTSKYDLFSQPDSPLLANNAQQIPKSGIIRDVNNLSGKSKTYSTSVDNQTNPGDPHTEVQFTDVNNKKDIVYDNKHECNEIIRETIVYKERPVKTIDKLLIFYSDNTFESFIPEKHSDDRK